MKRILLFFIGLSFLVSCETLNDSTPIINKDITQQYLLNGTLDVFLQNNQVFRYKGKPGTVTIPIGNQDLSKYESCFVLHVATGTTPATTVSSAMIKLDGLEVLNTSDFSKNSGQYTFEVCNLTPTSVISVEVRGEPGTCLDVWIEGKLLQITPIGKWNRKADFPGRNGYGSVGVSANGYAYVISGFENLGEVNIFTNESWKYDPANDTWTKIADFPGEARYAAVGFSIREKVYYGMGCCGRLDFWEYNTLTNIWTRKADFPRPAVESFSFSIGGKGYVGGGESFSSFWEYDPNNDVWASKADFPGGARRGAVGFSVESKGYAGTGLVGTEKMYKDFWEYDPLTNNWTQKEDFPGPACWLGFGFTLTGKGYIGSGIYGKDLWQYDPIKGNWNKCEDSPWTPWLGVSLSIGLKGYVALGDPNNTSSKQVWEFVP